jgi:hypothetical protein
LSHSRRTKGEAECINYQYVRVADAQPVTNERDDWRNALEDGELSAGALAAQIAHELAALRVRDAAQSYPTEWARKVEIERMLTPIADEIDELVALIPTSPEHRELRRTAVIGGLNKLLPLAREHRDLLAKMKLPTGDLVAKIEARLKNYWRNDDA